MSAQEFLEEPVDIKELERVAQSNISRLQALAQQGINFSTADLAMIKMEALIELLVVDEDAKIALAYIAELKKKDIIDQVMIELRKAQLMEGVSQTASKLRQ